MSMRDERSIHRSDRPRWQREPRGHIMEPSAGRTMFDQPGIGMEDLAWIQRDQFTHYVSMARSTHDPADWPTLRAALVEALTAAFSLDDEFSCRSGEVEVARAVLDSVRQAFDPKVEWNEFEDALWARRHEIRPDLC